MNSIKECWSASKAYRVLLIAAIVYAVLRLAIQIYLFNDALQPAAIAQGEQVSADLQLSYIPAAQHFKAGQDIYLKGSLDILEYQFPYSPAFAFFFMPILLLPISILVPLLVILHIVAYVLFYIWWNRIFERSNFAGITILAGGVGYGLQQYQDYFGFLARLSRDFPWWGPDKPFLGYNHSIMQIVLYYLGVSATNMRIATIIKLLFLIPLGLIALQFLRHPIDKPGLDVPKTALALTFALYLGAFIWLDMVWELSLGLVIFAYLLATIERKGTKTFLWILFAPYAVLDIWRLVSYIALGDSVLYEGSYVLTDPLIYVPWIMMILLVFYALLLQKLNKYAANPA